MQSTLNDVHFGAAVAVGKLVTELRFSYCCTVFQQGTRASRDGPVSEAIGPPGVHHGCHCRPGSCCTALWDTGHRELMTLMNLSAPCPVASIRSILLGNKCVWLTQIKHALHSHGHTLSPWPLPHATLLIPIGLSLWLQIFFTCFWHPPRLSRIFVTTTKAQSSLFSGGKKPHVAQSGIFVNMICETFQTTRQTEVESCTVCGWRRSQTPPRHV